ncbi:MAG: hypothetical protein K6T85_02840 [Gorillibacterium sp.]|nr:hypothetical protein [Gorillibacterium sp.]
MISLIKLNVMKVVDSEEKAAFWESKGFERVEEEPAEKSKTGKAKAEGGE